ncbi:succinylglutamate desuccinylase [Aliidiomarina sanyensis]|uniref:Succinylglutamate desuccinylase n=1 Tax=Aliidiomarina sanyensis TaxID=1249555 RepID=A0A432WNZ0_9GAMM|nr:succinylglutamate desuccinylase [Aliidiomarina sanyensis]RUO35429.1 succinylglutamate desuccinylase [Aliidiomarina sanyensis]
MTEVPAGNFLAFTRTHEWGVAIHAKQILPNGVTVEVWDSGVIVFTPLNDTSLDLVLSCAVHGDETAPIEIVDELIEAIRTGELVPTCRVMFLIANPAAMNIGERFVEENMNRLFSGAHSRGEGLINRERERAKQLEIYMDRFFNSSRAASEPRERIHYDMHTAIRDSAHEKFAVYPFQDGRPYSKRQLQLLKQMDVPVILLNDGPTTTFSYFSVNRFRAHGFTVELGKVRPFGQNDMTRFAKTKNQLKRLITQGAEVDGSFVAGDYHVYQVLRSINRTQADFSLNFPDDVANFTSFAKGDVLARDGDIVYQAEQEGESIIFPNAKVALGQRALLTVTAIPADTLNLV